MRWYRWFAGPMVTVAVVMSACGSGGDDESLDPAEPSTDTVAEQAEAADTGSSIDTDEVSEDQDDDPAVVSLTVDELETVVLGGWDLIWDEDFASLIELYTPDCQERLSVDDFEATLGQGVANLIELGVDFDDIGVEVAIDDFVENTSATSTSTLTFPGEEPSEENPSVWVIEDDEWRRADCDEIAGEGAAGGTGGIGSLEQPAAFGSAFDLDDWRATISDVRDPAAEGLLASFTEPPPPGQVDIMVTYVAVYFGEEIGSVDPFVLRGLGTTAYTSFDSGCVLAGDVLAEESITTVASALPGQQLAIATCLTVPEDELEGMVFQIEHVFSNIAPVASFSTTGETVADPGPRTFPDVNLAAGAITYGETIPLGADWTFQLVDVVDGIADGVTSEFNEDPPEGLTYVVVVHEAQYSGSDATVSDPFIIEGLGTEVYASISSLCSIDSAASAEAFGTTSDFEFEAGETYRAATCLTVPLSEVDNLVIKADNVFDFDADSVRFVR
jgi:hypothetical protein